jgi:hypothetical protein
MRIQWFVLLLLGGLACGQAAAPPAPAPANQPSPPRQAGPNAPPAAQAAPGAEAKAAEPTVAASDPVLTLKGFCDDPAKQGDNCQTVMTREQFDKIADALLPGMTMAVRRKLATAYALGLMKSAAAVKKGLDKTPLYDQMMSFERMQILSEVLKRNLQEEANKISDSDLEKYYNDNQRAYDQATMLRIFVPANQQVKAPLPSVTKAGAKMTDKETQAAREAREKAGQAAMKKLADSLQKRAVNGEDIDKLEKEAYLTAGLKQNPPTTKLDKIRRSNLPQAHGAVFDLKPGEVSPVFSDLGGHTIYKMVGKQTLALAAVKAEIHSALAGKRFREAMQAYQLGTNLDLNEAYFGPARNPAVPPTTRGGKPPSGNVNPD